jgi:hypothetical protein
VAELQRVRERRRAVLLARHYREAQGLSVEQVARRLGRSPATIRSYFYDPTAAKAARVKHGYHGVCARCGAETSGSGPGRDRAICGRCNGRASAEWDRPRIAAALRSWRERYGRPATSTDLSMSYASARAPRDNGVRLRRLQAGWEGGRWPAASVVQYHYGTVLAANRAALASGPV